MWHSANLAWYLFQAGPHWTMPLAHICPKRSRDESLLSWPGATFHSVSHFYNELLLTRMQQSPHRIVQAPTMLKPLSECHQPTFRPTKWTSSLPTNLRKCVLLGTPATVMVSWYVLDSVFSTHHRLIPSLSSLFISSLHIVKRVAFSSSFSTTCTNIVTWRERTRLWPANKVVIANQTGLKCEVNVDIRFIDPRTYMWMFTVRKKEPQSALLNG